MKALMITDHTIHELGCAAALKRFDTDITFLNIGSIYSKSQAREAERQVRIDSGTTKIRFFQTKNPSTTQRTFKSYDLIPNEVAKEDFDIVIATPQTPWYIGRWICNRQSVPLILRVPTLRSAKLMDHFKMGRSYEILLFGPSVLHNQFQMRLSDALISLDHWTNDFMKRVMREDSTLMYPTYAMIGNNLDEESSTAIHDLARIGGYVFSITVATRSGAGRIFDTFILRLFVEIAKENPGTIFVSIGTTESEAKTILGIEELPKNLRLLGRIYSDDLIKELYVNSRLVVCPIMSKSLSNRFLEALFFARPIVTNGITKLLYSECENHSNVIIEDDYRKYGTIVKNILQNDSELDALSAGARRLYGECFSSERCGRAMHRVIQDTIP